MNDDAESRAFARRMCIKDFLEVGTQNRRYYVSQDGDRYFTELENIAYSNTLFKGDEERAELVKLTEIESEVMVWLRERSIPVHWAVSEEANDPNMPGALLLEASATFSTPEQAFDFKVRWS